MPATPVPRTPIGRTTWLALLAMALAIFVIANDITAMSVALPAIEKDMDTDVSAVQWVANAYALIFGVLIVTGGRLADMFGRRTVLFVGAGIFSAFSLLGALSPSIWVLIGCRAGMGIGGALMWPAILGLVYAVLPDDRAGLAGALVLGTAGLGNAAGPLIGGVLTQEVSWRAILLLNLPIALVACLVTYRTVHVPQENTRGRLDYSGIATISLGLVALLVALDAGPDDGWTSPVVLAALGASVVLLVGFGLAERRAGDDGLIPPDVAANRPFRAACIAVLLMSPVFFVSLLYLPQFLAKVLGTGPLLSGAALLPLMGTFTVTSFVSGPLYNRFGAKAVVSTGAVGLVVGTFLLSRIDGSSGYAFLVPGMVVLGVGVGLFYSSVTTAGVTSLDPSRSSLAGGILYMCQIAGGAVGVGLTTTVFLTASNRALDHDLPGAGIDVSGADTEAVRGVLAGTDAAKGLVARFPGQVGEALEQLVRDAFTTGLAWGFRLVAVLALAGLIVSVLGVGGRLRSVRRR